MAGGGSIAQVYRATLKPRDLAFNVYVCRPLAAVVVYGLRGTRIAPNQVTFFSALLALAAAAALVAMPWPLGLWVGVAVYELSYVFDKVDGMLARLRRVESQVGHLLDFLMDEIKALLVLAAVSVGAFRHSGDAAPLMWGLAGLVSLSAGVGIATFQRRPEVVAARVAAIGAHAAARSGSASSVGGRLRRAVALAERVGQFFVHYPSYIWLAAALGDARLYLYPYVVANGLNAARLLLVLAVRYGRFAPRPPTRRSTRSSTRSPTRSPTRPGGPR